MALAARGGHDRAHGEASEKQQLLEVRRRETAASSEGTGAPRRRLGALGWRNDPDFGFMRPMSRFASDDPFLMGASSTAFKPARRRARSSLPAASDCHGDAPRCDEKL